MLFVSGQVPRDPRTGMVVGATVSEQTRQVVENLRRLLEAGGATLDDVVSVTCYLADERDWESFNAEYRQLFRAPYPTRTTVGAGLRDVLVEINAIAWIRSASE
jgi:2-iminobutanoate/2-iminopropanoate deaminase